LTPKPADVAAKQANDFVGATDPFTQEGGGLQQTKRSRPVRTLIKSRATRRSDLKMQDRSSLLHGMIDPKIAMTNHHEEDYRYFLYRIRLVESCRPLLQY
jgi:hypothetical protein